MESQLVLCDAYAIKVSLINKLSSSNLWYFRVLEFYCIKNP